MGLERYHPRIQDTDKVAGGYPRERESQDTGMGKCFLNQEVWPDLKQTEGDKV